MNRSILLLTAASLVVAGCGGQSYSPMRIESLTCEYRTNPLGIDNPKPRLGWVLASTMRGSRQTAYRIVVASSKEKLDAGTGYLWDTGKKSGDAAFNIPYDGALLTSNTMCWWKVQVWDENDKPTAFSQPAYWSTGLLSPDDWSASWIAMDRDDSLGSEKKEPGPQPVFFRQEFTVHKPVERAVIFSTARGIYDLYFNGKRLSDAVFAPGWTDYNVRVQYQTNDVTGKIKQGKNVLGAVVADG